MEAITKFFPIYRWLSKYNWKENVLADLTAGLTLSSLVLPQALAYSVLAGLPPAYGIYTSLVPVLIYGIFGTSKHLSMGTFSVTSLMLSQVISSAQVPNTLEDTINACMINSIVVGIIFLFITLTGLATYLKYISMGVINGFTTAVAVYTITSQLDSLLGMTFPKFDGFFYMYHKYTYLFVNIQDVCALSFSIGCLGVLVLTATSYINKVYAIQLPDVLAVVVVSTLALRFFPEIYRDNCVGVVGEIHSRLPRFVLPDFFVPYFFSVVRSSLAVAIVTGTMNITLVKSLAKTFEYEEEISDQQEILSYAITCIVAPLYESFLPSGSLSRSLVLASVGAKSSLASLFSVPCLVVILKYFSGFLETLPKPILAAVIINALQNALKQFLTLKQLWNEHKREFVDWIITFFAVVVLDIEYGLFVGIGFSLLVKLLIK